MIEIAPQYITKFIEYLNEKYPSNTDCYVTFYHGDECIKYMEHSDGCESYAEYSPTTRILHIPTQYPVGKTPRFLLESIAHEYIHHLQNENNVLLDNDIDEIEKNAETIAVSIVDNYLSV